MELKVPWTKMLSLASLIMVIRQTKNSGSPVAAGLPDAQASLMASSQVFNAEANFKAVLSPRCVEGKAHLDGGRWSRPNDQP